MKATKWLVTGALASFALVGGACRDRYEPARPVVNDPGVGGSGDLNNDGKRIGDGKIGRNNGVIDDGEGPLEGDHKADDKVGDRPGVWNDGEGPIENSDLNRPEK
jgi:hypothetical protein